jgi:predicted transcriptional regulator
MVVRLSEAVLGDPGEVLAYAKLELIGYLMGHSGVGVRELARGLEKNPATVLEQLVQLEEAGLIVKESQGPGKPATIRSLVRELTIRLTPGATA